MFLKKYPSISYLLRYLNIALKLPFRHAKRGGLIGLARLFLGLVQTYTAPLFVRLGRKCRYCPVCNWEGRHFLPYVSWSFVTFYAICPRCGSHERHRGHLLLYEHLGIREKDGKLLFIAPEAGILKYFQSSDRLSVKTSNYGVTERAKALKEDVADFNFNLMEIDYPDNSWDIIVCHRVIEHLPDDHQGMYELYRVLKPSGLLILSVPIAKNLPETVEFGFPDPLENDHFFRFGMDFPSRIPKQFQVQKVLFSDFIHLNDFFRMGLKEDFVFLCVKPLTGQSEQLEA